MFKFLFCMTSSWLMNPKIFPVVSLYLMGMVCFFGEVLSQSSLYLSEVSRPLVMLSFFVLGMSVSTAFLSMGENEKEGFCTWAMLIFFTVFFCLTSNNFFSFYFFLESTIIPTILLVLGLGNQPERFQAGTYLLVYMLFGMVPLIVLLGSVAGHSSMSFLLYKTFAFKGVVGLLGVVGFLFKAPMFPVHIWLPKAHVESPVGGSMILAGILLKMGVLGLFMVAPVISIGLGLKSLIVATTLLGGVACSVQCVRQTDMKSMIAYSSVSHMSLVVASFMSSTNFSAKGMVLMSVAHGIISPLMFSIASIFYELSSSRALMVCKGGLTLASGVQLLFFLVCCGSMSVPPSLNLVSEVLMVIGAISVSRACAILIFFMLTLTACYSFFWYSCGCHGSVFSLANPGFRGLSAFFLVVGVPLVIFLPASVMASYLM